MSEPNDEPVETSKATGRGRRRRAAARAGMPRIQLFGIAAVALLLLFVFGQKVMAQGNAPKASTTSGGGAAKLAPKAGEKIDPKKAAADAKAAEAKAATDTKNADKPGLNTGDEKPDEHKEEKKDDGKKEPETAYQLKTAEVGPSGGVPVHKDGEYRSPFADPKRGRVDARVGFMLENIEEYDIKKGSFVAHFFVSLTSATAMPPEVSITTTNGKLDSKETLADLPTFKLYKMVGTFNNKPDLHAYPFDTQELVIELEDDSTGTDSMRLTADLDHSFLDAGFDVAGWDLAYMRARILNHYYPDRFDNDDLYYSRYKFTLGIKRFGTSAVFTVFVPALVIVLISVSGLWFPREELEVRCNATTPMLAAAVLFHFALMQELPATAYLSRADKLMMAVYGCLGMHMLGSWIWFVFDEKHTETIFKWAKYICAPLTFVIMAVGILL